MISSWDMTVLIGGGRRWKDPIYPSNAAEDRVERGARAQGGLRLGVVREVVAADVGGLPLDGEEFGNDLRFVFREGVRQRGEDFLQRGIGILRGERLRPVEGEVEMGAAVVDGAELAAGGAVVF